jgi:anti-sigma factor RsiW
VGLLEASCAATAEALSDRLEGELRGLRRLRISRHLARCARCRVTLASLVRLVQALRALGGAEAPADRSVADRVLTRLREGSGVDGGD